MRRLVVLLFFLATSLSAETIRLSDAIQMALQHHFDIQISEYDVSIAKRNANVGEAGFLPQLSFNAAYSESVDDTTQTFLDGRVQSQTGAESNTTSWSLDLSWTVFDGFGQFYRLDRLGKVADLTEMQAKQTIETSVLEVVQVYLDIVRQQQVVDTAKDMVAVSAERMTRMDTKREIGAASRLEFLQAKVDFDTDQATLINEEVTLGNLKRTLNDFLGRRIRSTFNVDVAISIDRSLSVDELEAQLLDQNVVLQLASQNIKLTGIDKDLALSALFPEVALNANYRDINANSEAGFLQANETQGTTVGASLRWTFFDGFRLWNAISTAEELAKQESLRYDDVKSEVERQFVDTSVLYDSQLKLLDLATNSVDTAQLNFENAQLQFQLGQLTSTELRQAQLNLSEARVREINARFLAKFAEMRLYQLTGNLIL